jgi:hypothetical protein
LLNGNKLINYKLFALDRQYERLHVFLMLLIIGKYDGCIDWCRVCEVITYACISWRVLRS